MTRSLHAPRPLRPHQRLAPLIGLFSSSASSSVHSTLISSASVSRSSLSSSASWSSSSVRAQTASRPLLLLRSDIDFACQLVSQRTQFVVGPHTQVALLFVPASSASSSASISCARSSSTVHSRSSASRATSSSAHSSSVSVSHVSSTSQRPQLLVGFLCQQLSLIRPLFFVGLPLGQFCIAR
ncbi:hypothetical protein B0H14DRAFT_1142022 [Mycena olivaceomarginata]|nr:hypothetical protein B0H14DRAFT_1142022 [Mycena olivaceomarginata]